jgi:hypothetical protein
VTVACELLGAAELLHLGIAADEARQPAPGGRLEAGARRAGPRHLVDLHGVGEPLHRHETQRLHLDIALGQRQRIERDHDRAGIGKLLHASGEMRRLADRGIVHVQIRPDGTYDHLARVEPHADLDGHALRAEDLLRIPCDALLHPQRRVTRPDGMILVGEGRAEEGHDPVAHDLIHRALVAVDGLHHQLEDGVEELSRLLRVTAGEQLHRALEVGEEDRDLLTLAFQGGFRRENLLGEVLRRIRVRGGELGFRDSLERHRALAAELILGRVRRATGRTGCDKRCGALPTELHAGGILVLAPGTLHTAPFQRAEPERSDRCPELSLVHRRGQGRSGNHLVSGVAPLRWSTSKPSGEAPPVTDGSWSFRARGHVSFA